VRGEKGYLGLPRGAENKTIKAIRVIRKVEGRKRRGLLKSTGGEGSSATYVGKKKGGNQGKGDKRKGVGRSGHTVARGRTQKGEGKE